MNKLNNKTKIIICLILIIVLQLIFKIYIDTKKEDYFIDELYSYGLMNYKQAFIFEEESFLDNWHNKEYFDDYLIITEEEKMDWKPVYNNQKEDFHPPFYYLLLRIAATFTIGSFTKWTGLALNLIIFILADILIYFIGKKLFKNKKYALLLVFTYGFSKFSAENTLFIRMYQLLECELLLLVYWSMKNYHKKEIKILNIIELIVLIVIGTLTQYYYIIFMLGIIIVNTIKYIKKRQWKNLIKFISAIIISQILICMVFPKYTQQLSGNADRTEIETSVAGKISKIVERQKAYLSILDKNMFNIKITYIFLLMIALGVIIVLIKLIKNQKENVKFNINKNINLIVIPTILYWLLVTITSPYIALRYIQPIFVFIMIITIYYLKKELYYIIQNKKTIFNMLLAVSIMCTILFFKSTNFEYQYSSNKQKYENIIKYKDIPCIYMYVPNPVLKNDFVGDLNCVRQFEKVYIMNSISFSPKSVERALKQIDTSNGIIIMDADDRSLRKVERIIDEIDEFASYEKIETINVDRMDTNLYWLY